MNMNTLHGATAAFTF